MYLIRHDASGNVHDISFRYSNNAYDYAIERVMDSGEAYSVLWAREGQEGTFGLVEGEIMLTISGGNATNDTLHEGAYKRAALNLNEV